MKPQKRRKRRKRQNTIAGLNKTVVLLILFCVLVSCAAMVAAKYIKQDSKVNTVTAKEFYFTSDLLDGKTHEIAATENGIASVTFQLSNHADALRYSEVDIVYDISAKEMGTSTGTNAVKIEPSSGKISGGTVADEKITVRELEAGKTYMITAKATEPYSKELTGTLTVRALDKTVHASMTESGAYIEVTVWTVDGSGKVFLSYSGSLIPDNTDSYMKGAKTEGAQISIGDWKTNTSHVFRFFKSDSSKTYSVSVNGKVVTVNEK